MAGHRVCFIVGLGVLLVAVGSVWLFVYNPMRAMYEVEVEALRCLLAQSRLEKEAALTRLEGQLCMYRNAMTMLSRKGKLAFLGFFDVTAYDSTGVESDELTSTGLTVGDGIFAVNPHSVPYGSLLYIPALGKYGVAGDTGGALRKNPGLIDIYIPVSENAVEFGRQRLEVFKVDLGGS